MDTIHDLVGQPYLKREGVRIESLQEVGHVMELGPLLRGDIQAQSVYVTTEPFELDEAGILYQIYFAPFRWYRLLRR